MCWNGHSGRQGCLDPRSHEGSRVEFGGDDSRSRLPGNPGVIGSTLNHPGEARPRAVPPAGRVLRRLATRDSLIVFGCVFAAGEFGVYYSSRVITWAVMTDELQTTRLATSI